MLKRLMVGLGLVLAFSAPAQAQIAHIVSSTTATYDGTSATTTDALNTTGANFCAVMVGLFDAVGSSSLTVTDSKGNSYSSLTYYGSGFGGENAQIFYTTSSTPTVGASHTFTATAANGNQPGVTASCYSGVGSSPFDQQNGTVTAGGSPGNYPTGSVTPTTTGELVLTFAFHCCSGGETISITSGGSGFTQFNDQTYYNSARKIQTSISAENVTWTNSIPSFADPAVAVIATFKPAGGGGGPTFPPAIINGLVCCRVASKQPSFRFKPF